MWALEKATKTICLVHISSSFFFFFWEILHVVAVTKLKTQQQNTELVCRQPGRWAPAQGSLVNGDGNTSLPHALTSHALWRDIWCILWWCTWHSNALFYSPCHTKLTKQFTNTNKWSCVIIPLDLIGSLTTSLVPLFYVKPEFSAVNWHARSIIGQGSVKIKSYDSKIWR